MRTSPSAPAGDAHDRGGEASSAEGAHAYRLASWTIRQALRSGALAGAMSRAAKVWLRHARTVSFLREFRFDGVVDGGANVGEFAHLVRLALPGADLLCVEPHPGCARRLRLAGFRVEEAALWHAPGDLVLTQPDGRTTSGTVMPVAGGATSRSVRAVRLDALPVAGERLLVKLDLQGAEPQALEGMGALWGRCAALLLEVSVGSRGDYEPLRARLGEEGFAEYSTLNELEVDGRVVEADKVWVRARSL